MSTAQVEKSSWNVYQAIFFIVDAVIGSEILTFFCVFYKR